MSKVAKLTVDNTEISIIQHNETDYISLTDMVKNFEGKNAIIGNWMRSKNTIEYLGVWEQIHNDTFKLLDFEEFMSQAGDRKFTLSPKQWVQKTNAVGIVSTSGRYGGTYAHKDIAFKFGSWLSATFELLLIKEFQRLKEVENNAYNLEWNVRRVLSKVNYRLHTDSIRDYILPTLNINEDKQWIVYAVEADILNVAVFGCTAKQWKEANPTAALEGSNIRDIASINELAVLSNLESTNSVMISEGIDKQERFNKLLKIAKVQMKSLNSQDFIKALKHTSETTYPDAVKEQASLSPFNKTLRQATDYNPNENKE
ncbi:MAG: KilA-N domain-containing protein [Flavobacteriales bacterium]|nr:KilA-N domain-containing protein [Flavobacteriales bacterium]MBL4898793.1 KilA-N domain-containing protein [Colwellia sp.]